MLLSHAIILALVQGISEFLPISSSAHLVLIPDLMGWPDQGTAFDVSVHLGTLLAVLWAFRIDLARYAGAIIGNTQDQTQSATRAELARIAVATVPATLVGGLLVTVGPGQTRDPIWIAIFSALFAIALGIAEWRSNRPRHRATGTVGNMSMRVAIGIGCAQALALFPGASRSGVSITAAMLLGLNRTESARFSFLLAIPIIALAAAYGLYSWWQDPTPIAALPFVSAILLSALVAFAAIRLLLRFIERIGLWPFVIYRLLLSALLIFLYI